MSLFGPVDDDDLRRWQEQKVRVLGELIRLAFVQKLPPLDWRVTPLDLSGQATQESPDDRRAAWMAWANALDVPADNRDRLVLSGGVERLRARTEYVFMRRPVAVLLLAHIIPPPDDAPDEKSGPDAPDALPHHLTDHSLDHVTDVPGGDAR